MSRKLVITVLAIVVLCPGSCCLTSVLYTRLAGPWAAEQMLPEPPSGRPVGEYTAKEYGYIKNVRMVLLSTSLADSRAWFNQYAAMDPLTPQDTTSDSSPAFGFKQFDAYMWLVLAGNVLYPQYGDYFWDDYPDCENIKLYKTFDIIPLSELAPFPKIEPFTAQDYRSIVLISRCWPDY